MTSYEAAVNLIRAQDVARELALVGKGNLESMRQVRDRLRDYRAARFADNSR